MSSKKTQTKRRRKQEMDVNRLKQIARQLFSHYHAKLMAETSFMGTLDNSQFSTLDAEPAKVQTSFQKASLSCAGVGAKPRDYIEAQFVMFEKFTQFFGRRVVPQPTQLFGINAQARYAQWFKEREDDEERSERKTKKVVRGKYTLDERNLKALVRSLRMPETDVLCEKPDEFSVDFLKQKGVYSIVKARRRELVGAS